MKIIEPTPDGGVRLMGDTAFAAWDIVCGPDGQIISATVEVRQADLRASELEQWEEARARIHPSLLGKLVSGGWAVLMNRLGIGCSTDDVASARRKVCELCPEGLLTPCGRNKDGLCCGELLSGKGSNPDNPGCGCRLEEKWQRANAQCPHGHW